MTRRNDRRSARGWKPEFASQAERLCAFGFTNADLAEFFAVEEATIAHWQARLPGFARAVKAGRKRADERGEPSLYRRAIGYTRTTAKPFFAKGSSNPVIAMCEEHVPPNAHAALHWLKMHFPDAWSAPEDATEPQPAEHKGTVIVLPDNGR